MSNAQELPGLNSFRASMKAGNMPADYPAEALAQLALDLRAAESFVRTPEGAHALGVFKLDRPSNQFNADEAWTALSKTERIALAEALGRYRRSLEEAVAAQPPVQAASALTKPLTMRQKVKKVLKIIHEKTGGATDHPLEPNEIYGDMVAAGLDPTEADSILDRLAKRSSIVITNLAGRFELTAEGADEAEDGGAAAYAESPLVRISADRSKTTCRWASSSECLAAQRREKKARSPPTPR
jgi:hypothetical protein